jgi:2-polyprenyl-6-methoxyphenol hydroxylase-like FAD-dependent oxidoreductase
MSAATDLRDVLIVGGGIGGMATAIMLARHGVVADLVDIDPEWRVYGAGISISGPTFRAFGALGVMDDIRDQGFISQGLRLARADGAVFAEFPAAGGHSGGGIMRPVLHRILADRVRAAGTNVRLGVSVEAFEHEDAGVTVTFTDCSRKHYDLVVASDGVYSKVRTMLFPGAPAPAFTGQGCWRIMTARPPDQDWSCIYYAGIKAGISPVGAATMYCYSLQELPGNPRLDTAEYPTLLRKHLKPFGGIIGEIRDAIGPESTIVYRPLEKLLLESPWFVGRVLLIGDAVHATTPHLASGAGMAVEDACVLVDELAHASSVDAGLASFMERRFERCRIVVENSVRMGELEMAAAPDREQAELMRETMTTLAGSV